ncbi:MAG: N-acetylmuramoyl-L-alanine amidase [Phycisphaerales bacterium]|nr:MAG: N-acetylmuramoyl-L-alanine amidase [Phycisphaerales bacterium]
MRIRLGLRILLVSALATIAGCQPGGLTAPGEVVVPEERMISIQQLAGLLGMRVADVARTHVVLRDRTNTVLLFTTSDGRVYVNARPAGQVGKIEIINGRLHVGESLAGRIKAAMDRPSARPYRPPTRSSGTIVIDAGHGGHDPGAVSVSGFYEKTVNLAVARKVASLLRGKGLVVVMTRGGDQFVELEDRAAISNRYNARLFVSIHADSAPRRSARGFTIYVARAASWAARRAASLISRAMAETGLANNGVQRADYRVLVQTQGPAVLIELGYLSNPQDERLLRSVSFQNRLAQAIADGIAKSVVGAIP